MRTPLALSPLGTAREAVVDASPVPSSGSAAASERDLLSWYRKICETLKALYGIEDESALIAWEVARWQDGLELIEQQALILLVVTMLIHLRQGSTRVWLRGKEGRAVRFDLASRALKGIEPAPGGLTLEPMHAVELIETLIDAKRLGAVIGGVEDFKPLIISGDHIYLQRMLYLEDRFTEVLRKRLDAKRDDDDTAAIERALSDVQKRPAVRNGQTLQLNDEQISAVREAVRHPMTIISGGPGSGKTTIVLSILRTLRRLGVHCEEIALAAPTGKAANRMGDAIEAGRSQIADLAPDDHDLKNLGEPLTLHRLLGYSQRTGRFSHHENNRLAQSVVIVDEASMIDLGLMERLIRSLRDGSRFILLGDAHQLPSVEAGNVLRDLLAISEASNRPAPAPFGVRLLESHRMRAEDENGKKILAVAQAIDQGVRPIIAASHAADDMIVERSSVTDITLRGVEFLPAIEGPIVLDTFLDRWHRDLIRSDQRVNDLIERDYRIVDGSFTEADQKSLHEAFEHWEQFRILCVTRVSQTRGANHVNAVLHQRWLDEQKVPSQRDRELAPGEPVMMLVNDYNRGVFNGDQGLVLNVIDHGRVEPMAVFRRSDGFVAFHVDSLRSVLVHSYAMTVHKAQGSEFNTVVIILPDRDLPINTREIIYTALTRSRRGAVIIGDREILGAGIRRTISRDSGIVAKFRGAEH